MATSAGGDKHVETKTSQYGQRDEPVILVENIALPGGAIKVIEDKLTIYFQNESVNGGGDVENVEIISSSPLTARITFYKDSVAQSVSSREHKIFGQSVQVMKGNRDTELGTVKQNMVSTSTQTSRSRQDAAKYLLSHKDGNEPKGIGTACAESQTDDKVPMVSTSTQTSKSSQDRAEYLLSDSDGNEQERSRTACAESQTEEKVLVDTSSQCVLLNKDKAAFSTEAIEENSSSQAEKVNEAHFSEVVTTFNLNHFQLTEKEAQYLLNDIAKDFLIKGKCNPDGSVIIKGTLAQIAAVEKRLRLIIEAKTSVQKEMASSGQSAHMNEFQKNTTDDKRKEFVADLNAQEDTMSNLACALNTGNKAVQNPEIRDEIRVDEAEQAAAAFGFEVVNIPSDKCPKLNVKTQGEKAEGRKDKIATERKEDIDNGQESSRKRDEILKENNEQVLPEENGMLQRESDDVEESNNLDTTSNKREGNKIVERTIILSNTTDHESGKDNTQKRGEKSKTKRLEMEDGSSESKPLQQPTAGVLDKDKIQHHDGKVEQTVHNSETGSQQSKAEKRDSDQIKEARYGPGSSEGEVENSMKSNDTEKMQETETVKNALKPALSRLENESTRKGSGETSLEEDSHILCYMEMIHSDEIVNITERYKVDIQWKAGTQIVHFKANPDCSEGNLGRAYRKFSGLFNRIKAKLKYGIVDASSKKKLSDTTVEKAKQRVQKYNDKVILFDIEKYKFKLLSEDDEALGKSLKEFSDLLGVKKLPKLCSYIEVPEEATGGDEICSSTKHKSDQSKPQASQESVDAENVTMQVPLEPDMLGYFFCAKAEALNNLKQKYHVDLKRIEECILEISPDKDRRKDKEERVEAAYNEIVNLVQSLHTKLSHKDIDFKDKTVPNNIVINDAKKQTKIVHKNVYIKDVSPTCIRIYGEGDSAKLASEMLCRRLGLPVPGSRHGKGNKTDTSTSASSGAPSYQRQHSGSSSTEAIGSTLFESTSSTGTKVSIKYGDITKEKVDAIVNAANDKLQHSGGVAAAIVNAGGYSIQTESDKITDKRTLNVGEVVCTKAGSLPCKAVLHVVGPYWNPYDADTVTAYLYDCCWNLLTQASNWDYKSVAIPAIGTGIYRVPKPVCAQMMFKAVKDFTDQQVYNDRLRRIIFIDIDWETVKTFEDVFRRSSSVQRTQDREPSNHALGSSVDPPSTMHMQVALPTTHPLSQPGMTQSATYAKVAAPQSASANKHHYSQEKPQNQVKGRATSGASHGVDDDNDNKCPICLDDMKKPKALPCKHKFCKKCKEEAEKKIGPTCPVCKVAYGIITGNMPNGTMSHRVDRYSLSGYSQCGTIVISYNFRHGIQGKEHPNPGRPYTGTSRTAYLPDNVEGREVLRLLKIAFDRRLTFTIGDSRTTSASNTVTWNDIHHKTFMTGGALNYGYPDPNYLKRVKEELADKGVK